MDKKYVMFNDQLNVCFESLKELKKMDQILILIKCYFNYLFLFSIKRNYRSADPDQMPTFDEN